MCCTSELECQSTKRLSNDESDFFCHSILQIVGTSKCLDHDAAMLALTVSTPSNGSCAQKHIR